MHGRPLLEVLSWVAGILSAALAIYLWLAPERKEAAGATTSVDLKAVQNTWYSRGSLVMHGTWNYDLDRGVQTEDRSRADVWWEQKTLTERALTPKNGAKFSLVGVRDFTSLGRSELSLLSYSSDPVRADDTQLNRIPVGTVVAYLTKEKRYGKLRIDSYGYDLSVTWETFN